MEQKKIIKWAALAIIIANLGLVMYVVFGGLKTVRVPNPNGMDDFIKAGALLKEDVYELSDSNGVTTVSRDILQHWVESNAASLKLIESGLLKLCLCTNEPSMAYVTNVLNPRLEQFQRCARLLLAAGRLAELDGRTNDALNLYIDVTRFGQQTARGGWYIQRLNGIHCETKTTANLDRLRPTLEARQCTIVASALELLDAQQESGKDIIAREHEAGVRMVGQRLSFIRLLYYKSISQREQAYLASIDASTARLRRTMLSFAERAYELDKGKPPANAAALVPEYLKKIPEDPVTGKPMEIR